MALPVDSERTRTSRTETAGAEGFDGVAVRLCAPSSELPRVLLGRRYAGGSGRGDPSIARVGGLKAVVVRREASSLSLLHPWPPSMPSVLKVVEQASRSFAGARGVHTQQPPHVAKLVRALPALRHVALGLRCARWGYCGQALSICGPDALHNRPSAFRDHDLRGGNACGPGGGRPGRGRDKAAAIAKDKLPTGCLYCVIIGAGAER
jgi:hypothetical protein